MTFDDLVKAAQNEVDDSVVNHYKSDKAHIIVVIWDDVTDGQDPTCYLVTDEQAYMEAYKANRPDHDSEIDAFWDVLQDFKADMVSSEE